MSIKIDGVNNALVDANGNEYVKYSPTASAVNEPTLTNAATGTNPRISATGDDTNIGLSLRPKGSTGVVVIEDHNGNEVVKAGVGTASAVNEVTVTNAATGNDPAVEPTGGDTNANLLLKGKGTGKAALGTKNQTATAVAGAATLNEQSGVITSEALTTAAGADYVLTLTNSKIAATDKVFASVDNGTNTTEGLAVNRVTPGSGSVTIRIRNTHASSALNGTIKVQFFAIP